MSDEAALVHASGELNPLVPHPLEIALLLHVLLAMTVLVVGVVLACTRRVRMGWVGWLGFLVLAIGPFLFVGPVAAAALLAVRAGDRPAPVVPAPAPVAVEHVCRCGQPANHPH